MKHIKKRFLFESEQNLLDESNETFTTYDANDLKSPSSVFKGKEGYLTFIQREGGYTYGAFVHKIDGREYLFPIPDPTLIYFHNAQIHLEIIKRERKNLLTALDIEKGLSETGINQIFSFYGAVSNFVINLFTALESFINQRIPDDFNYVLVSKKSTISYNKKQIMESLQFDEKLKEVLPKATGKIINTTSPKFQRINELKIFRDSIVHTKPGTSNTKYDELIKKAIKFNYRESLEAVADVMNTFKKDYIIECDCGRDF